MWQRSVILASYRTWSVSPRTSFVMRSRQICSGVIPSISVSGTRSPEIRNQSELSIKLRRISFDVSFMRSIHISSILDQEVRTVTTPQFADSITEGDVRWHKAVGDLVTEDDVIGEIETDKTSIPLPAPASGVITELLFSDGDKVTAGVQLYRIKIGASDGKAVVKDESIKEPVKEERAAQVSKVETAASGQNLSGPIPTQAPTVSAPPKEPISSRPVLSTPVIPVVKQESSGQRIESRVKMSKMRQRISERLKESQNTAAMLTTFNEVDMSNIIEMRNKYKDQFLKSHNVKLGFMSPFVKAAAYALKHLPVVNAVIDGKEILYRDYIDISVAVASPKGLVVPVIRNVEDMSYADIEKAIMELSKKAQDSTLAIEDMTGGTFTISNGGVFGSLMGTPIINPPQSAILGMHATFDRPVAINGKVEIRPMMYVALTYDHRLIDGREAVTFLKKIKSAVEDPRTLLLEL